MEFNESLKKLIDHQNLKQADLCRMTGIQTSLISDYLSGKKSPTIGNAVLIADALRVPLDQLVGRYAEQEKERSQDSVVLLELYEIVRELTDDEQLYLLDTVKALKLRLHK